MVKTLIIVFNDTNSISFVSHENTFLSFNKAPKDADRRPNRPQGWRRDADALWLYTNPTWCGNVYVSSTGQTNPLHGLQRSKLFTYVCTHTRLFIIMYSFR